jgi:hypothetical protein
VALDGVALDYVKPMAARYNLVLNQGTMSLNGEIEYAPWFKMLHVHELRLDALHADFVHTPRTAGAEQAVREKVGKAAEKASNAPGALAVLNGKFMGAGPRWLARRSARRLTGRTSTSTSVSRIPRCAPMNDLLRAYGKFDVMGWE